MKKIEGLYTIQEIFDGRLFRIPDYQRGYAWKLEQIEALWEDIENIIDNDTKIHYTGVVIVQQLTGYDVNKWMHEFEGMHVRLIDGKFHFNDNIQLKPLYLADGQQRLTSIIILLNCLIRNEKLLSKKETINKFLYKEIDNKILPIFGYEYDSPAYHFFINQVLQLEYDTHEFQETSYTNNIRNAKKYFNDKISSLNDYDLHLVYYHVLNSLRFNFYELPLELNIFTVFETMNYRGKSLSTLELLKNRLIYLIDISIQGSLVEKNQLRAKINSSWTNIYQNLALNPEKLINDDEYLRIHWLIYFKQDRKGAPDLAKYKQDLLDERFIKRNIQSSEAEENYVSIEDIEAYVDSLDICSKYYFMLKFPFHQESTLSQNLGIWIGKIGKLQSKTYFEPLMLAAIIKEESEDKLLTFFKNIERYIFIVFGIGGLKSNVNKTPFLIEANKYFKRDKDIDVIIEKLKPEKTYKDKTLKSGEPAVKLPDIDDLKDNFLKNRQKDRSDEGFLCWKTVKYFMQEYELSLLINDAIDDAEAVLANTLEPIFPPQLEIPKRDKDKAAMYKNFNTQRFRNWQSCIEGFGKDTGQMYLSYSLGNIVLTFHSKAGSAAAFEQKKDWFSTGTKSKMELCSYEQWGPKEILDRGIKLLEFMENRWDIRLDHTFKKQLLYLNQLNIPDDHIVIREYKPPVVDLFSVDTDMQPADEPE